MKSDYLQNEIEEYLASQRIPEGCEECVVVEVQGLLVWMRMEEVRPDERICFYDGDLRNVLLRTDPRVESRFQ